MKIEIDFAFCTDGDYSFDVDKARTFVMEKSSSNNKCASDWNLEINTDVSDGEYDFWDYKGAVTVENKEDDVQCKIDAKMFLKKILCDFVHVSYTHYWIVNHLYGAVDTLIIFLCNCDSGTHTEELSGNYEGTYISVRISK